MQDAHISRWGQGSHVSAEVMDSLHDLNHRFLDWAGARAGAPSADWAESSRGVLPALLAGQVATLSAAQRAAAAHCPYALFDLRFQDQTYWQLRLQSTRQWQVADERLIDSETANFVRLALFYAWHVAASAKLAAQLLLGMNEPTVVAFRRMRVNELPALVATEALNLTARWSHNGPYWTALVGSASRMESVGLRRAQLFGLQLAAAARLPEAQWG